jgi:hypothetical protein
MVKRDLGVPRPNPKSPFQVIANNPHALKDGDDLVRLRRSAAAELWDHVANLPTPPIGSRYGPLNGDQASFLYQGERLRQCQYEIDKRARVKVAVGKEFVVITGVSLGHPKVNE